MPRPRGHRVAAAVAITAICAGSCSRIDVRLGALGASDTGPVAGFDAGPRDSGAGIDAGDAGGLDAGLPDMDSGPDAGRDLDASPDAARACETESGTRRRSCVCSPEETVDAGGDGPSEVVACAAAAGDSSCFVYIDPCTDRNYLVCDDLSRDSVLREKCFSFCEMFEAEPWATACTEVLAMRDAG